MKNICIIPARGGSKGVLKKNIRLLDGIPLIAHTIITALNSKNIDIVYVSTDNNEISDISQKYGASIINRPNSYAKDNSSSEDALLHAINYVRKLGEEINLAIFLQCTSPFRKHNDIDNAINQLLLENADSLLSVTLNHKFIWKMLDSLPYSINYDYKKRPRRQDMELQYLENGSIYVFKPWILDRYKNRIGGKISLYVMDEIAAIDIDSELDLLFANLIINNKNINNNN